MNNFDRQGQQVGLFAFFSALTMSIIIGATGFICLVMSIVLR